jgi:myosin-crossreactive antigen
MSSTITKRALSNASAKLLETRPLDKITISEITNVCGVNRMTFYLSDGKSFEEMDLPMKAKLGLKKALKKIKNTDIEKLLYETGLLK